MAVSAHASIRPPLVAAGTAPAVARAVACAGFLGVLPHLVRCAASGLSPMAEADRLRALLAPPLFLATVVLLALLVARRAWGWPIDRAVAQRWLSEGATFAVASTALFLLLHPPAGTGGFGWNGQEFFGLAGVTLPALTEELVYRGILAVVISSSLASVAGRRARAALTVVFCSAAFSVAHEFAPFTGPWSPDLLRRFAAGIVLGSLAWRSRSLLPSMFAHAAYNALVRAF